MGKVELTQESFLENLQLTKSYIEEERELALDRYKRQDDNITSDEQFILQAKGITDLLKIAADRSNAIFAIVRLQAQILFKDQNIGQTTGLSAEEIQKEIQKQLGDFDHDSDLPANDKGK